jgi:GxxExxY protein
VNKEEGNSAPMTNDAHEKLIKSVIDAGYHLHRELGSGLLESVYKTVFAHRLERMGLNVVRQMLVSIVIDGLSFADAYRIDLFVSDWLMIELKAHERLLGVHVRQAQTYVQLLNQLYGLIMNFGCETFGEGVRRIYNNR